MFLSVRDASVLDNSNPLGIESGEWFDQGEGFGGLGPEFCLRGADGCQLGWLASDIEITANKAWLSENPSARALLERIEMSVFDISALNFEWEASGRTAASLRRLSDQWIASNQADINAWLADAINAQ